VNLHVLLGLPHERGHLLSPALTPLQGPGGFRPFQQLQQPRVLSPLLPPARDEGHETCSECLVVNTSESEDDRVYHSALDEGCIHSLLRLPNKDDCCKNVRRHKIISGDPTEKGRQDLSKHVNRILFADTRMGRKVQLV
jgi:hypothetical protein